MIVIFEQQYLRNLYEHGTTNDKKHHFEPYIEKYKERIDTLKRTLKIEDLFLISSLKYEVLQGDKQGISSIGVNHKYRIEFTVKENDNDTLLSVCNIIELSNHYK